MNNLREAADALHTNIAKLLDKGATASQVADLYNKASRLLTLVPADDATEVTVGWLMEMGFENVHDCIVLEFEGLYGFVFVEEDIRWCFNKEHPGVILKTRGDIRRLLAALKLETKGTT